jgi:hypothetical protein
LVGKNLNEKKITRTQRNQSNPNFLIFAAIMLKLHCCTFFFEISHVQQREELVKYAYLELMTARQTPHAFLKQKTTATVDKMLAHRGNHHLLHLRSKSFMFGLLYPA